MSPKNQPKTPPVETISDSDPWAEQQWPYMKQKLEAVGASPGEVEDFRVQWLDNDWEHDDKVRVLALGDGKLRAELEQARIDGDRDTLTEEEADAKAAEQVRSQDLAALRAEAEEMSAWEPDDIMEWAGDDVAKIAALLDVEQAHPQPRHDLIERLESLLG